MGRQEPLIESKSLRKREREYGLRSYIVDPAASYFDWASEDCATGRHLDGLVAAIAADLDEGRPVALGVMMPTWIPITRKAAASSEPQDFLQTSLLDFNSILATLRGRVGKLRGFVGWRTFVEAPGPKLYVWEAFRPERREDCDLPSILASFATATTAKKHDAVISADDVFSLVGALLLRAGLTDDITVLRTPCVLVGKPDPDQERIRREREERDQEFVATLVKMALRAWCEKNGHPEHAKLFASARADDASERAARAKSRRATDRSRH